MVYWFGVDIGGIFIDFVLFGEVILCIYKILFMLVVLEEVIF